MTADTTVVASVLDRVAHGIAVLTLVDDAGERRGMTISSLTGASAEPPTVLMCIRNQASMRPWLVPGQMVGISVLGSDQAGVSAGFAYGAEDPFAVFPWHPDAVGTPAVAGAAGYLRCIVERVVDNHDTAIVIAAVEDAEVFGEDGLVYWMKQYQTGLVPVDRGRW